MLRGMIATVLEICLPWLAVYTIYLFPSRGAVREGASQINLAQLHFDQTTLATYNDQPKPLIVEGVVIAEPNTRDTYTNLRVEADRLIIADQTGGLRAGFYRF